LTAADLLPRVGHLLAKEALNVRPVRRRSRLAWLVAALVPVVLAIPANRAAANTTTHTWIQAQPAVSPPGRGSPAMEYDRVSRDVVAFGGYLARSYVNDTWLFDGSTWSQASPPTSPPARAGAGIAYDAAARTLVMFGGYDGHHDLGDTWVWDGATSTWTKRSPASSPPALTGPMMFTDPLNGHADLFGGFDGQFFHNQTWQWTGGDWQLLQPATSPTGRGAGMAALDGATRQAVIFSGIGSLNVYDTWTFDGTTWTLASPTVQPPPRFYVGQAFDPRNRSVILFGGGSPSGQLNDTWAWTGSDWTELQPSSSPSVRESPGMAFDRRTGRIVLFGGQSGNALVNDTWTL
jgi:hypothetical protein